MATRRGAQARAGDSNLDKYTDEQQFNLMLQRIGVSRAAINHLQSDDFTSMEVIVSQYKNNIDEFVTYLKTVNKSSDNVRFSPVVSNRLISVVHYFIQSTTCFHVVPNISMINRAFTTGLSEAYSMYKQFKEEDAEDEIIIDLPELKGHDNWVQYRDKFLSNLDNTSGSNGTPLAYVVDDEPRTVTTRNQPYVEEQTLEMDTWDFYRMSMVHFGQHFKRDNNKVWQMLKKSLLGTHPYHHVDHCSARENGRQAWKALRAYYEGEDYVNRTIQECLTKVRTMYYRGETPRFNFERFIDRQKECYKRLRDVGYNGGLGLDDASMCANLKQMILPEAQLENALSLARTQGLFNGRFDDLVHFLKAEVNELTLRRSQVRSNRGHRISSVGGRMSGGRGRGGRGPGRYNNFNSSRNRQLITRMVDGRRIHNGNYSPDEYRRLTPAQREAVRDMRRQAQRNSSNRRNESNRNGQRNHNVSAVGRRNESNGAAEEEENSDETVPVSSSGPAVRFAQSGNVGTFLGNRRNHQANRDNHSSE